MKMADDTFKLTVLALQGKEAKEPSPRFHAVEAYRKDMKYFIKFISRTIFHALNHLINTKTRLTGLFLFG